MRSRCRNSLGIVLALALSGAARADDDPLCGPFDGQEGEVQPAACGEPGIAPVRAPLEAADVVELAAPVRAARALARPGEALLALPKGADGQLPEGYALGEGARIASSFFSPVLCATVVRVVGPAGAGVSALVTQLPPTAAAVPHSVYLPAGAGPARERRAEAARGAEADDPYRGLQYALDALEVERIWRVADGTGVTVALLDSAPDAAHRELSGVRIVALEGSPPAAPGTHGTLLAGVIAARSGNHYGIRGVAPGADLVAIPVCARERADDDERCGLFEILRGLDAAWEQRARVVNLSLVGPSNPLLERAVARLERLGVAVVAAAGNEGTEQARYPAAYPSVLGVGAVDRAGERSPRSNRGLSVKLLAPGVEIVSTAPHARFAFASGTSLSAAHVSGVVALLVSAGVTPEDARRALLPEGAAEVPQLASACDLLARTGGSCAR